MNRNKTHFVLSLLIFLGLVSAANIQAQRRARTLKPLPIPSPASVLGFSPGDDRTIADWRQITDYFGRLDKASGRVKVEAIGQSTLGKVMIAAFISAEENIQNLSRLQEIQKKLSDPRLVHTEIERNRLFDLGKAVVVISCSIHATEIVASQMSLQLAFDLATASDSETREILQNTILILIPSPNPDGIDIVANWYRKTVKTPYEGSDPPELYHHYAGHDNNRDWFMLNLKETQALTQLFWQQWYPEVVYDVHQHSADGPRFFLPPFYPPSNPNISPLLLEEAGALGRKLAADLQASGQKGVISNSQYDTWWHGGFRTAPYFHNSIGFLSEAADAKLMSPVTISAEQLSRARAPGMSNALDPTTNFPDPWPGGDWHPLDIVKLELISARSLLLSVARSRMKYLRTFYELNERNIQESPPDGEPIAYLIPAGQGRDEAVVKLLATLIDQGIEVYRLDQELHASFGPQILQRTNYAAEKYGIFRKIIAATSSLHEVPAGSYIIFVSQPQRPNVLSLFEPQNYPRSLTSSGEEARPYDVTGWTLPMQMGVDAPAVTIIKEAATERRLTLMRTGNEVRKDLALPLQTNAHSAFANPLLEKVRIGLYRSWLANIDEGWTRFVLDSFNVPFTSLRDTDVHQQDLAKNFDAIILPSQSSREIMEGNLPKSYPAEFTGGIGMAGVTNLKRFVEDGGTLICFDQSCDLPIKQFSLPVRNVLEGLPMSEFYSPGSIVSLEVDTVSPLARAIPSRVDAFFRNSSAFEITDKQTKVIARYARDNVLRSGWILREDRLKGRVALAEVAFGKGKVILFAFRPQHRAQTWGTFPFLWNALNESVGEKGIKGEG